MPDSGTFGISSEAISAFRQRLESIRGQIRKQFEASRIAIQTAAMLSAQTDLLMIDLFEQTLVTLSPEQRALLSRDSALLAVGGSGRGELAPYSDYDLLLLHRPEIGKSFNRHAAEYVRNCWDVGIKLGHSVRTVSDALQMARTDVQFSTSLLEARLLWGSDSLAQQLLKSMRTSLLQRRQSWFISWCVESREKERQQHNSTATELEPDVKRSAGGLRDLHLIRWIGAAAYGTSDIPSLKLRGVFSRDDARRLLQAHEFLLGVRIELHLLAGKPQDVLSRSDQLRISERRGIAPTTGQLPVERFMQQYFQHSTTVAEIVQRFVNRHRPQSRPLAMLRALVAHRVDGILRVSHDQVDVPLRFRQGALASLETILKLYHAAVLYRLPLAADLQDQIKQRMSELTVEVTPAAIATFRAILSQTGRLGATLRAMYQSGVLEAVLPEFRHIRCLLQFNQYHSYTVDEHTLRTIESIEALQQNNDELGRAYREIRHKDIVHLALLLHDAGKGYEEDHSEVGARLAQGVSERFQLSERDRENLVFLVHQHLMMAHLAFRRDISDPPVLLKFSHQVGSVDTLQMLYTLTAADITAVGPGVWNDWKAELLASLYSQTLLTLGGESESQQVAVRQKRIREQTLPLLTTGKDRIEPGEALALFADLPTHYILASTPAQIAADLRIVRSRPADGVFVDGTYDSETGSTEYRVITHEQVATGCFHRIAASLTAKRLETLSATIATTGSGIVLDRYRVRDGDHEGEIPQFRVDEICSTIEKVLRGQVSIDQILKPPRRFQGGGQSCLISNLPLRVVLDNDSSDRCTVIDVFAHDRPGLLYALGRTLFDLGLSIELAKISTHFDQVVDVFYVTESTGRKVADSQRLKQIQEAVLAAIERVEAVSGVDSTGGITASEPP